MLGNQSRGAPKTNFVLVNIYIAIIFIVACIISYRLFIDPKPLTIHTINYIAWILLVITADIAPIRLPRGEAVLSVGGAIDIGIVLLFPTGLAALAGFISGVVNSAVRMVELRRLIFNASMNIIMMTAASEVVRLFGAKLTYFDQADIASWPVGRIILAVSVAVVVYFSINHGLTSIAISLDNKMSLLNVWRRNYMWTIITAISIGPIALMLSVVYYMLSTNILLALFGSLIFIFPLIVVRSSYKWFTGVNNAYFNSIKALINALDASHPYTQGHSKRVAQNAVKVAQALKLSDKEIEQVEQGAVLHDIGKIGLDKAILDKAGPLNSLEWARVKMHPILGSSIVKDLSFLQGSKNIILYHHERFDGRGYPAGLQGDGIPIGARIVNVVDALDALTSHRSYRQALSVEEAISILHVHSNQQFDSEVVQTVEYLYNQGNLIFQDDAIQEDDQEILFTIFEINVIFSNLSN